MIFFSGRFVDSWGSGMQSAADIANAEQDREAWKTFLHGMQADSGVVSEHVWQFVPKVDSVSHEMSERRRIIAHEAG